MIFIKNKEDCCGCGACYNICPKEAVRMIEDNEGFLYPNINENSCINCGLCEKVCPVIHKGMREDGEEPLAYIIRYNKEEIVKESTSGGGFSAFAIPFLEKGGIVYGAGYDDKMNVVCKKTTKIFGLKEMRGSKFVQSSMGMIYRQIQNELKQNKKVLFSGTPCQVAALIGFIGGHPSNLFCVDFVCRGVPSPGLWRNYIDMMEKRFHSKVIGVKFKNKTYGYHATTMRVKFDNGKIYYASGRIDPYMKAFVKEMASRPSCGKCAFKGTKRLSDITLFDCYEFSNITGKKDDDKGYTSLFVHTEKGKNMLQQIKNNLICYPEQLERLIDENGIMVRNSAKPNKKRKEFFEQVQNFPIDEAMKKVDAITIKDKMIEKMKIYLYHLGLIQLVKGLRRQHTVEIVDVDREKE